VEHLLEGEHFVLRDDAIGLGHLRAKGNHADGEGNGFFGNGTLAGKPRKEITD